MQKASYWVHDGKQVRCTLCPHTCLIQDEKTGRCGIRRATKGTLVAEAYARISSLAMDPIEKKPLFHVKPGQSILSLGSAGCNFCCSFCQNWNISQKLPSLSTVTPQQVVAEAQAQGACGIAYTYNEPLINFEYVLDCAKLIREKGLLNVIVSNGYINPEPLQELLPWIDAWNVDIKSIVPEFYQRFCGAELDPVLNNVKVIAQHTHLEITHLIVTEGNDDLKQIRDLVDWIASVSTDIPLHFTRYYPQYQWEAPPTDPELIMQAQAIAKEKLAWVYLGNLGASDDSLYCPECQEMLVKRRGYQTQSVTIADGSCPQCKRKIPGIF
jgi:pyruvate formate lyase activating enzyme